MAEGRGSSQDDPDRDYLLGSPSRENTGLTRSPPPSYGSLVSQTGQSAVSASGNMPSSDYQSRDNLTGIGGEHGTGTTVAPSNGAQFKREAGSSLSGKAPWTSSSPSPLPPPPSERSDVLDSATPGVPEHLVFRARLFSALVLTVYMAAYIGASPLTSQYVYLRLMPDYINFNDSDNSSLDLNPCTENASDPRVQAMADLQSAVAEILLYFSLAGTGPMILAAIVMGSYSDVMGRKFLFLIPTVAGLLKMIITAVIIKIELSLNYFYVVNVLEGFSGSFAGLLLAVYAYTADLTAPAKSRTLAIAILEACLAIAGAGSDIGVGYLIKYVDYFYAALLMTFFAAVAVVMVLFLPETVRKRSNASSPSPHLPTPPNGSCTTSSPSTAAQPPAASHNPFQFIQHIFGFYFTAGTRRRRAQFIVALISLSLTLISFLGSNNVSVLYQLNAPFCWGSDQIGIFGGVNVMVRAFGSVLSVHFLQRCLSDAAIAAVTLLTGAASNLLLGFATSPVWLYGSVVAGAMSNAALPVTRAILSKMAGASKQGALFASIAVTETLCTLASNTLYNTVYEATVAHVRGAVFFLMAGVIVCNFLLVLVFMRISSGYSLLSEEVQSLEADIQTSQSGEFNKRDNDFNRR